LSRSIKEDERDFMARESGSKLDKVLEEEKENMDAGGEAMNIALNDLASIRDPSIPQSPKKKWDDSQKM
jgi:hypothetical protein